MKKVKIVFFLVIALFIFLGFKEYNDSFDQDFNNFYNMQEKCQYDDKMELCDLILKSKPPVKLDAFTLTIHVIRNTKFRYMILLIPLFMIYMGTKKLNKNKFKKDILDIWKNSLIVPSIVLIMFLLSILVSNNFNYLNTIKINIALLPEKFYSISFIITYLLVLLLRGIFWLNLGIICSKKSKNWFLSLLKAYILYVILAFAGELIPGNYFKFSYIWSYENVSSLLLMIISSLFLVVVTTFIICKQYNGKLKSL